MSPFSLLKKYNRFTTVSLSVLTAVLIGWLYFTPPGLLGKADAIGYAVCHQISERTFHMGDRPLPLCARCSGMYIGALTGILFQIRDGRRGGMPSKKIFVVLGLLTVMFAIDGVNSYIHLIPGFPGLYEPNNLLRLLTGTGVGIGMSLVLLPVIHQTLWLNWNPESNVSRWNEFVPILISALAAGGLLFTGNPLLLYPLGVLSAGTVLVILGSIYSIVWVMILKKENAFEKKVEVVPYFALGFSIAILQVFIIDMIRLGATGSWNGLNFF